MSSDIPVRRLPDGTVTFMFTDIEGSTSLLQRLGPRYDEVQRAHDTAMRRAIATGSGVEVRTIGDAFFVVFPSATDAVRTAVEAQRLLAADERLSQHHVRVRMGLHTGEGRLGGDDYIGIDVNRAARISSVAHGGQVLLSDATKAVVRRSLPEGVTLLDLGDHTLKDLPDPVSLSQLVIDGLPSEFPALRTMGSVPHNLPADLDDFVGREMEIRGARKLLERTRLLTLTGPGGVGKTRLAIRLATDLLDTRTDGVFVVHLSGTARPDVVPSVVLETLGVHVLDNKAPPAEVLLRHLADRSMLLVLDNFEQILDAASFVEEMLKRCPGVTVIVTSRAALRIQGEQEMEVPPLDLPDRSERSLAEVRRVEAVDLFETRARAVQSDFEIDESNVDDVVALTTSVDGLPLAIELAAAWVKVLTPRAILERLGERVFGWGHQRGGIAHQRTLNDTIGWSYSLLDEAHQRLFDRLSIFSDSAGLEQMEAVCGDADDLGVDLLVGISNLVDHSLLRKTERFGEPRYRMLRTIREYAAARLVARGERDLIARRHFDAYLGWAESAAPHLTSDDAGRWLDLFTVEHDNLRTALQSCIDARHADGARQLAASMWRFWQMRGHLHEGRRVLEEVLALPGGESQVALIDAHEALGGIAYWQGDMRVAQGAYQKALELARDHGDETTIARGLYNLAFAEIFVENVDGALDLLEESLERFTTLDDVSGVALATWGLANATFEAQRFEESHGHAARAVEAFETMGDRFNLGWALFTMAEADTRMGNYLESIEHLDRGLRLFAETDDVSALVLFLDAYAEVALALGEEERAVRLAGASLGLRKRSGTGLVSVSASNRTERAVELERLQATLPEVLAEGAAMTDMQAISYALREAAADTAPVAGDEAG